MERTQEQRKQDKARGTRVNSFVSGLYIPKFTQACCGSTPLANYLCSKVRLTGKYFPYITHFTAHTPIFLFVQSFLPVTCRDWTGGSLVV